MARETLSAGMLLRRASSSARRRRALAEASPPPMRAATVISLMIFVKILPRLASCAPFRCLMLDHLLWPLMNLLPRCRSALLYHCCEAKWESPAAAVVVLGR